MASKKTKGKDAEPPEETSDTEDPVRERQLYLQEELRTLTQHLHTYLGRAEQLLHANKRLEKEAQDTREQSQSYLSCAAKLSQDPPGTVITLGQQNCQDLARARALQDELVPQLGGEEQQVRSALQHAEAEASLLDAQLAQLEPYKEQKARAEQKLKALQRELRLTRIRCAEQSHGARSSFLQDRARCEQQLQHSMQRLTWGAEEVALQALLQHVRRVKAENRLLRQELQRLLQHCQLLRDSRSQLQELQEQLQREQRCAQRARGAPALLARQGGPRSPKRPAVPGRN